jgi:hypothetical protein
MSEKQSKNCSPTPARLPGQTPDLGAGVGSEMALRDHGILALIAAAATGLAPI